MYWHRDSIRIDSFFYKKKLFTASLYRCTRKYFNSSILCVKALHLYLTKRISRFLYSLCWLPGLLGMLIPTQWHMPDTSFALKFLQGLFLSAEFKFHVNCNCFKVSCICFYYKVPSWKCLCTSGCSWKNLIFSRYLDPYPK